MSMFVQCPDCPLTFRPQGMGSHRRHAHGYRTHGARPDRGHVYGTTGPFLCPDCGRPARTAAGLGAHRFKSHGLLGASHAAKENLRRSLIRGVVLDRDQAEQLRARAPLPWYLRALDGERVERWAPTDRPCRRAAPQPIRVAQGTVHLGGCDCGYRVASIRRYEVLEALLAGHEPPGSCPAPPSPTSREATA